jgi:homoserine kinase type II
MLFDTRSVMKKHRKLTQEDTIAILGAYRLGALQHCSFIERGHVNEKWVLTTKGGQYVLKRRHASLSQRTLVQAQHALVGHLCDLGFPAPALVRTHDGNTFLDYGGDVYELQEFVLGYPFSAAEPSQLIAAARTLGFYHNTVRGFDHEVLHRSVERYGAATLSRTVRRVLQSWQPSMQPELRSLTEQLEEHVQDIVLRDPRSGQLSELVIHGDYHGANLVLQEDSVVGVVDYDLAHWCTRVMEVAEAIIAFCTDPATELEHIVYTGVLDLEVVSRFVTAYLAVAPLSESEIRALPNMIRTIWLCASLDPPLEPPLNRSAAPKALPEILMLADWALDHGSELVAICLAAQET